MAMKDPYEVLGVSRTAGDAEIKKAYRRLARKFHPDVNPGDTSAHNRFQEIASAYELLKDSKRKERYDRFGDAGRPRSPGSGCTSAWAIREGRGRRRRLPMVG